MRNTKNYGGNILRNIGFEEELVLSNGEYTYRLISPKKTKLITIENLQSYVIHCIKDGNGVLIVCKEDRFILKSGMSIKANGLSVSIIAESQSVILIAGVTEHVFKKTESIEFFEEKDIYKVNKPWGSEFWFTGKESSGFCLKKIEIRSGTKTSLQYHRFKKETNLLYGGQAKLHFKNNELKDNDQVSDQDISSIEISAGVAVDVRPMTLHRIESITDITLYEASTDHLDDVVRVMDDTNRANGLILEEHKK
jgi:hypothetical protein